MRSVHLGPADRVTLVRAVLTAGITGLVVPALTGAAPGWWRAAVTVMGTTALVLDGVDGWVARHTGTSSAAGARFDMETDAALVLVLSVAAASDLGAWVLLIGLARYLLLAAQTLHPRLRDPLPPRFWRKVVAVAQGVGLLVAVSGLVPPAVAAPGLAVALALLAVSFGTEAVERARTGPPPRRTRTVTTGAVLVVWFALVTPAALSADGAGIAWSWSAVRVPAEGLVLAGLALALPRRPGRVVGTVTGLLVGLLVVLTALDTGFPLVLDRSFDVLGDWTYLVSAVGVVADTHGGVVAALGAATSLVAALAVVATAAWAGARVTDAARGNRSRTAPFVVALASLALVSGGSAGGADPGLVTAPSATALADQAAAVRAAFADPATFAGDIADDPWGGIPANRLLTALRGHDVLLVVVESYGRSALEDPGLAPTVVDALDRGEHDLAAVGYASRSAFLTSPTFGGGSWLAHSTLQSGTWVDSQRRYEQLTASDRLTLSRAFSRAGWRTVIAAPAVTRPWPEARTFYGVDALLDATNDDYRGPAFGYATAPDQYTLSHLARTELVPGDRSPVMAEVDLVTSHHPWTPLPRLVPWDEVGDGSVFASAGARAIVAGGGPNRLREDYARSIAYSLGAVTGLPATVPDGDLVLIVVGDHQPHHEVSGADPGRDVPVSVVARDPAVLRAVDAWGWEPGLHPSPDAPVERMDTLRDRVLATFSVRRG